MEAPPGFEPGMEVLQKTDRLFPAGPNQAFLQQIQPLPADRALRPGTWFL